MLLPSCLPAYLRAALPLQLYKLGDNRELLVTVNVADPANPESSAVTVDLTTTLPVTGAHTSCGRGAGAGVGAQLPAVCPAGDAGWQGGWVVAAAAQQLHVSKSCSN